MTNATDKTRSTHWTCWKNSVVEDMVHVELGRQFNEGQILNVKEDGVQ